MESKIKKFNATICAADDSDESNAFNIVANAGSLMDFGAECVALDISEQTVINTHTQKPPLLVDHDYGRPVGHIESLNVDGDIIRARGVFSIDNDDSRRIKASLKNGFPWQASLGFTINAGYKYRAGDIAKTRNGKAFKCSKKTTVTNDFTVWECSIVLFGADNQTDVKLSAANLKLLEGEKLENEKQTDNQPPIDNNKIEAKQPDVDEMKRAALAKIRDAEQAELERIGKIKEIAYRSISY